MPGRWTTGAILVFWLAMTAWMLQRDLLPRLGYGELSYRRLLADRAVPESSNWIVQAGGRNVGVLTMTTQPRADGSYELSSRGFVGTSVLGIEVPARDPSELTSHISLESKFWITPMGRLDRLAIDIDVENTPLKVKIFGIVQEKELVLKMKGLPLVGDEMRIPFDAEQIVMDSFGPVDRIPDLRPGKTWTTTILNPMASLLPTAGLFGMQGPAIETVVHRVIDIETITWGEDPRVCHVVEHRHPSATVRTWAAASDGKVLRHEVPIAGMKVTLELDPMLDRAKGRAEF